MALIRINARTGGAYLVFRVGGNRERAVAVGPGEATAAPAGAPGQPNAATRRKPREHTRPLRGYTYSAATTLRCSPARTDGPRPSAWGHMNYD